MPIHTVTKHGTTKSGKNVVYFDNKHNYTDMVFLGRETETPPVGASIDAMTTSKNFDDGKTLWFLNNWALTANQGNGVHAAPAVSLTAPIKPLPMQPGYVAPALSPSEIRQTIFNVWASAIGAGVIKDPMDLTAWSEGVEKALVKLGSISEKF